MIKTAGPWPETKLDSAKSPLKKISRLCTFNVLGNTKKMQKPVSLLKPFYYFFFVGNVENPDPLAFMQIWICEHCQLVYGLLFLKCKPFLCSGLCEHPRHYQAGERREISHSQEEIFPRVLQQSLLTILGPWRLLPHGSELQLIGHRPPAAAAACCLSHLHTAVWQWRRGQR